MRGRRRVVADRRSTENRPPEKALLRGRGPSRRRRHSRAEQHQRGRVRSGRDEGVVAQRAPPSPTPPGVPTGGEADETHARTRAAGARAGLDGHGPGLGAPPADAGQRHVRGRPRPVRAGPGRGQGPRHARRRSRRTARRPSSRSPARSRPTRRRPAASRWSTPTFEALTDAADTPPVELLAADPDRRAADPARPRRGQPAAPGPAGRAGSSRRPACAASGTTLDAARLHRGAQPQAGRLGHRERRERVRGRLLRPAGLPRAVAAVLQAGAGRGVRAGLRGRAGVPRRAARHRAAPRGVRLARRRARLRRATTATSSRCCATSSPGWSRPCTSTPSEAVELLGARRTRGARGAPGAALPRGARDRRRARRRARPGPGARAGGRRRGRRREHGSDLVVVEGYPTASRAFYSHPDPEDPHWSRSFDLIFRGRRAGQRGAAAAPATPTTSRRWRRAGYAAARRTRPTSTRSGTASRRTAASRSGSSGGCRRLTGAANVREVTLFPRDLHRLTP